VFVTSPQLLATCGPSIKAPPLPNVADGAHFAAGMDQPWRAGRLGRLPAPRIGFVRCISAYKLDLTLAGRPLRGATQLVVCADRSGGRRGPSRMWAASWRRWQRAPAGTPAVHALPAYLKGLIWAAVPCA